MTSEDLKLVIRTVLDETGFKQAKKSAADLGNTMEKQAKQTASANGQTNASVEELRDSLDRLRNLQFSDMLVSHWDKITERVDILKQSVGTVGTTIKDAVGEIGVMVTAIKDFHNDTGKEQGLSLFGSAKLMAEENGEFITEALGKIKEANKAAIQSFKNLGDAIVEAIGGRAVIAIGAAIAAVAALVAATRNAINTATRMKEVFYEASSLGLTVSQYQEWGYIFESVGESVDDLADAVKTLSSEQAILAEGSDGNKAAFKELGLSVAEVTKMTQDDLFRETVTRLQNVEDAVKRTTLAYQIFGEDTAARLTNVLNLNNAEMVKLSENFYLLGGGASSGFIEKSRTLASSIQSLRVAWTGLTNTLAEIFMPVVTTVVNALTKAIVVVNLFLKTIFGLDFSPAAETAGVASGGISGIGDAASGAKDEVEKLKRATMGFDELNIVTNPASSKSDDGGAGGGLGDGAIGVTESAFDKAKVKLDDFKNKVQDFLDKWETQIKIISAALGALAVTKLLTSLGKAIGLGETFLKTMGTIKKLAGAAIVITLQYSLVNEFMSSYIDSGELKDYIAGLITAAIGTGILYKIWKPGGLIIGLGVTAVASLKAVIDNGGITNAESATVALTGLASAIGAFSLAINKFVGWDKVWAGLKGLPALLKGLPAQISGAFAAIPGALKTAGAAVSGFVKGIGGGFAAAGGAIKGFLAAVGGLVGGGVAAGAAIVVAAIAAIASVVIFLKRNWDSVVKAFQNFFNSNILPKLESIRESWEKIKTAIGNLGKSLVELFPGLAGVIAKIGEVVGKFFEWIGQFDLIQGLGTILEVLGGIITGILGGVVMGAINAVIGVIDGFVQAITGVVEIVSGVVTAIVKLFSGDFQGALDAVKQIGQGIVDVFVGLYDATIGAVVEFVKGIIDWFVQLWDELVGHSIVPDMINAIVDWFKNMPGRVFEAVQEFVDGVITRIKKLWSDITGWFSTNVAPKFTKQYWINKFDSVRAAAQEKFTAVKNTIQGIWNNIKTWFGSNIAPKFTASYWTNKFGSVKTGAKSAFNGVIGVVEGAVNGIIGKVNTLSWTIPDWVPKFGGDKFGFNFKSISIPRLAAGGITTGSVVANIGENGREAVLPLDKNTAWMDRLADRIAARNGSPTKVVLKVGERELGEATIHAINQNTRMNGGLQLQLV